MAVEMVVNVDEGLTQQLVALGALGAVERIPERPVHDLEATGGSRRPGRALLVLLGLDIEMQDVELLGGRDRGVEVDQTRLHSLNHLLPTAREDVVAILDQQLNLDAGGLELSVPGSHCRGVVDRT